MKILYFFLFSFLFIACNTPVINKNDVVAEVNGEQILLSELASQSKQEIFDIPKIRKQSQWQSQLQ